MIKKKRNKPFLKQFLKLRKNVQNRVRIFKVNSQKWKKFQMAANRRLRFFKRFKMYDQICLPTTKFASRGNSFRKNFRNKLIIRKSFNLFYGKLKKKYLKKKIKKTLKSKFRSFEFRNFNYHLIESFESRLDVILYRAKFSLHIENARQLIKHGHVLVNNQTVKKKSFIIKPGDLISIKPTKKSFDLVKTEINKSSFFWPLPPNFLIINYNTLQIFFGFTENQVLSLNFHFNLNLNSVISNKHVF